MTWITPVTYEEASADAKRYIDERQGALQSEKCAILLKNAVVYDSVEKNGWRMDEEVQRLVGKRMGDLLNVIKFSFTYCSVKQCSI